MDLAKRRNFVKQPKQITVSWRMTSPPLEPTGESIWDSLPVASLEDQALEGGLGWPPATIAVLREAFNRKLSRFQRWTTSPEIPPEPITKAASVFRRGVAASNQQSKVVSGRYDIGFVDSSDPAEVLPQGPDIFLILDHNVREGWPKLAGLASYVLSMTEKSKTLETVSQIVSAWEAKGKPRQWVIVGGGVLADTAAFAASLCQAPFTLVPTTLLSMVDACIGGKTGVNFPPFGKNQVGHFSFPDQVQVLPAFLATLPKRHQLAGAFEAIKHGFLSNNMRLVEELPNIIDPKHPNFLALLREAIQVKSEVVKRDPNESGVRATLNLGHTLAHALEAISHAQGQEILLHGEAVGFGLLYAILLSEQVIGMPKTEAHLAKQALKELPSRSELEHYLGHPIDHPKLFPELLHHIRLDKKMTDSSGNSRWILMKRFGECATHDGAYTVPVSDHDLEACWKAFIDHLT